MTDRLAYTVQETAQLMGGSPWQVRRLIAAGKLQRVDTGDTRVLITADSINRLTRSPQAEDEERGRPVAWLKDGELRIDLQALGLGAVKELPALPLLRAQDADYKVRPLSRRASR